MSNFVFSKVRSPMDFDFKECMYYCQESFGISKEQINSIIKHIVKPSSISPSKIYFYILKLGDQNVGCSIIYYLTELKIAFLDYIVVFPKYRNLGYGTVLYMHICLELKQVHPDISGIFYEVYNGDKNFIKRVNFFEKQGAELIALDESCRCFSEVPVMYHSLNGDQAETCPVYCVFETLKLILA